MSYRKIPSAPEQKESRSLLMDLMTRQLNMPTQPVADLTDEERANIGMMQGMLQRTGPLFNLLMGQYEDILSGKFDPATSMAYRGFRGEAKDLQADEASRIKRRAQRGGMLRSYPTGRLLNENARRTDSMLLSKLGQMYETDRGRAMNYPAVQGQAMANVQAGQAMAGQPRQIEQAKQNAMFKAILAKLLAPYKYQSPIAQFILEEPRYQYIDEGSSGMLGGIGSVLGGAGGLMGGLGGVEGLGSIAGGDWWKSLIPTRV
jgi:hypothetical protein